MPKSRSFQYWMPPSMSWDALKNTCGDDITSLMVREPRCIWTEGYFDPQATVRGKMLWLGNQSGQRLEVNRHCLTPIWKSQEGRKRQVSPPDLGEEVTYIVWGSMCKVYRPRNFSSPPIFRLPQLADILSLIVSSRSKPFILSPTTC